VWGESRGRDEGIMEGEDTEAAERTSGEVFDFITNYNFRWYTYTFLLETYFRNSLF